MELLFGIAGLGALARGVWLAFAKRPRASSWLAAGSAALPLLAFGFPGQYEVALLFIAATATGFSAAATVFMLERLRSQERRSALAHADEDELRRLLDEASRSDDVS